MIFMLGRLNRSMVPQNQAAGMKAGVVINLELVEGLIPVLDLVDRT